MVTRGRNGQRNQKVDGRSVIAGYIRSRQRKTRGMESGRGTKVREVREIGADYEPIVVHSKLGMVSTG